MTQEKAQGVLAKSLRSFGYESANVKSPAVKVEELGGLDLQFSIQARMRTIRLEVYTNRGYDKDELRRCLPISGWHPDGCDYGAVRRLNEVKNGVEVSFDTHVEWGNLGTPEIGALVRAYKSLREKVAPAIPCPANEISNDLYERAARFYTNYREAVDLVLSCRGLFDEGPAVLETRESCVRAIDDLEADLDAFSPLRDYLGFNAFKVLKLDQQEIRHSNVLAWLLDVRGSHGSGDVFLKRFMGSLKAAVAGAAGDGLLIEDGAKERLCADMPLDDFRIFREDDDEDIKLESEKNRLVIVIENKWNAKAGLTQLRDYHKRVSDELERRNASVRDGERKWAAIFAYLTLSGNRAEKNKDDVHWLALAYADVREAVSDALEGNVVPEGCPKSFLWQYRRILEMKPELMRKSDPLVRACGEIYRRHKLGLRLSRDATGRYFASNIEAVLSRLQARHGISVWKGNGLRLVLLRLKTLNGMLGLSESKANGGANVPYWLELELDAQGSRVCCNLKRYETEEKGHAVVWHKKPQNREDGAANDKNWKPFSIGSGDSWNTLENAVSDALSDVEAFAIADQARFVRKVTES